METSVPWIVFNGLSPHIIVMCVVTLCLLMVSALVSGAETAFFSLSHSDVRKLREDGSAAGEAVLALLKNVDVLLATILVVNNLVNICIVIVAAGIIDTIFTFSRFEFLFKTVFVTFLLLLFGEILPKVLAQSMSVRFACFVARPIRLLRWLFYPLSYILVNTGGRISEKAGHRNEISLDDLADAVDMTQGASPEEHVMLAGIVSFVNTEAVEIMKPRVDITAVELTDNYETVKRIIIGSGFSRIPVYEDDIDNIKGTLYVKDLLPYINH
ncbi:MAG: CNNM domain-containing protein, partial [Alistipes sp.]